MRVSLRPTSLFAKAALTLTIAFIYFGLVTFAAVVYYVQVPVARRSAEDLSTFILLVSRSWSVQPPATRERFEAEIYKTYGLRLSADRQPLDDPPPFTPYLGLLEKSLDERAGHPMPVRSNVIDGVRWFWVETPVNEQYLRVGFARDRIGGRLPSALLLVLLGTTALILATAMALTRRITRPLHLLSDAADRVGKGLEPDPLPETGPTELASLIRQFNRMGHQVRELLANRTILLAGISHDLRTPISRMRLALEMLPPGDDPELVEGLKRDLENMNRLIGDVLALSRDLETARREPVDLADLLDELTASAGQQGAVEWTPGAPCVRPVRVTAVRRIIGNLLENALRYGAGAPIDLVLECGQGEAVIRVLDRGPGIPEEQQEAVFRPFYRLELSRSADTGGSGLGLAIARQLADANGWKLRLSPREGGGTQADLVIPGPPMKEAAA
jgi:two-component system osmolarity sensor histidine kinase EnvZ